MQLLLLLAMSNFDDWGAMLTNENEGLSIPVKLSGCVTC